MEFGVIMNRQDILNIINIIDCHIRKTEDMQDIKRLLIELVEKDEKEMDEYFNSKYNYEDFLESPMPLDYCSDDVPF